MRSKVLKGKLAAFLVVFLIFIGAMVTYSVVYRSTPAEPTSKVLLMTSMGNITIELFNDMPITTGNFKNLTENGTYDGTIFHRVISGFMIQGGDPTSTGYGDPSIPSIPDEFTDHNHNDKYTVAMANRNTDTEKNTGSSQFFINLVNNNYLDSQHPVFGRVIEGTDVVDRIGEVPTYTQADEDANPLNLTVKKDRPKTDVTIVKAILLG